MSKSCHKCNAPLVNTANFCTSCGASVTQDASVEETDPYIGQLFAGNFQVQERIGVGSMGVVYLAEQLSLKKKVALKILKGNAAQSQEALQRFQREARAASRLNHPNSISIFDFGQNEDGASFIAMEYLDGHDLGQVLSEEFPLDPERVVNLLIQVCSALDEAHAAGIIHRDLKPANIVVSKRRSGEEFVKVLDFGIAKLNDPEASGGPHLTQDGLICGTPAFMSPEQVKGLELDPRTDIYALGVVLFMLLTGRLPFQANSSAGMAAKIITEAPPRPSKVRLDLQVPDLFDPIIERAMAKQREDRYESALAFRAALEDALQRLKAPAQAAAAPVILPAPPPAGHGASKPGGPAAGPPHLRQQPGAMMAANLKAAEARLTGAQSPVKGKGKKPTPDAALATRIDVPVMADDEPVRISRGAGFYVGILFVLLLIAGGGFGVWWYIQQSPDALALITGGPSAAGEQDPKPLRNAVERAQYYVQLAAIRGETQSTQPDGAPPASAPEPPASAPLASAEPPASAPPTSAPSAPASAQPPASVADAPPEPEPAPERPRGRSADDEYKQGQALITTNPQQALQHFEAAVRLNPRHRNAWLGIHRLANRINNEPKARQACLKVIALSPRQDLARSSCERWMKRSGN